MGYNPTIKSLQKVRRYLDAMATSQQTLVWLSKEPKKLAYQLHEALVAAEKLNFTTYIELRSKWRIRYKLDRVIAELQSESHSAEGVLSFEGVFDPLDVVQTVIKHKATDFALSFPDASKTDEDIELIKAWCADNNYDYVSSSDGLTIHPIPLRETNGNSQAATS